MNMSKSGQSMFELLIAIFVVAITLVAFLGLVTGSIGNSTFSKERSQAGSYTQEAVEWLRSQRDSDWAAFTARASATGTTNCLQTLSWSGSACGSASYISGTRFIREVTLIYNATAEQVEARVVTRWTDSSGLHESKATTYLTNWRTK